MLLTYVLLVTYVKLSLCEDCSRQRFVPDPTADVLLHATLVSHQQNALMVQFLEIVWGDLSASPSACWQGATLQITVRTKCGDHLEIGNDYLFSLTTSSSTCPTAFYGGTYASILQTPRRKIRDAQSNTAIGTYMRIVQLAAF